MIPMNCPVCDDAYKVASTCYMSWFIIWVIVDEHAGYLLTTVGLSFYFYCIAASFVGIQVYAKIRVTNDTEAWKKALDESYTAWVIQMEACWQPSYLCSEFVLESCEFSTHVATANDRCTFYGCDLQKLW